MSNKDKQDPNFLTVCSSSLLVFVSLDTFIIWPGQNGEQKRLTSQLSGPRGSLKGVRFKKSANNSGV